MATGTGFLQLRGGGRKFSEATGGHLGPCARVGGARTPPSRLPTPTRSLWLHLSRPEPVGAPGYVAAPGAPSPVHRVPVRAVCAGRRSGPGIRPSPRDALELVLISRGCPGRKVVLQESGCGALGPAHHVARVQSSESGLGQRQEVFPLKQTESWRSPSLPLFLFGVHLVREPRAGPRTTG